MVWLIGIVLLMALVGGLKYEWDHSEPDPHAQGGGSVPQRRDRAHHILAQGGPQTLAEYLDIFPEACPRCGSRYMYESTILRRSFLTPLLRNRQPKRTWVCTRCGHHNLEKLPIKPLLYIRHVPSPYLSEKQVQAIPEWPSDHPPVFPVYVHNDNGTPMEFVVDVLEEVFELQRNVAIALMYFTHQFGRSFVIALPFAEAQKKVAIAQQRGKAKNYPLQFTVDNEWT